MVEFKTTDKLLLPGLLYEPAAKTKKAAIFLHGMSSSVFYQVNRTNEVASSLLKKQITYLTFNNRGSGLVQYLNVEGKKDGKTIGMAYESIKDCIKDIDGAFQYLKRLGYEQFYLIGHSTGANKICVYNYYRPKNSFVKYVLLGGGDDTGLAYHDLGKAKFYQMLKKAKGEISRHRGQDIPFKKLHIGTEFFSYQSHYDILNPDGDYNTFPFKERIEGIKLSKKPLFRHYKSINKPSLVVYGANDEYCYGKVPEIVTILREEAAAPNRFDFKIIEAADHGFHGQETELAKVIADWL